MLQSMLIISDFSCYKYEHIYSVEHTVLVISTSALNFEGLWFEYQPGFSLTPSTRILG
jgi:hypothetical protein